MVISPSGYRWVPELVQELESWCEPAIAHPLSWKAGLVGVTSPLASRVCSCIPLCSWIRSGIGSLENQTQSVFAREARIGTWSAPGWWKGPPVLLTLCTDSRAEPFSQLTAA